MATGAVSASPKVRPVAATVKPALAPVIRNLSDSPDTWSSLTVIVKEPEPLAAPPLMVASKVLSAMS